MYEGSLKSVELNIERSIISLNVIFHRIIIFNRISVRQSNRAWKYNIKWKVIRASVDVKLLVYEGVSCKVWINFSF